MSSTSLDFLGGPDSLNGSPGFTGDFSMHGVTKRIAIPVEILGLGPVREGEKAEFATTFVVDRKDYGIIWNRKLDQGGALLGDDVLVSILLETVSAAPKPPEASKPPGR